VVIDAEVILSDARDAVMATTKTDVFGDFRFDQVEPGAYSVSLPGFSLAPIAVDVSTEDRYVGDIAVG
jgi:predicted N-acetyltransferase YhbS